jgi:hypothetical protein
MYSPAKIPSDEVAQRRFIKQTLADELQLQRENPKQSGYLRFRAELIRCKTLTKL